MKSKTDKIILKVLENRDVSRLLCIALAKEASNQDVSDLDAKIMARAFRDILKSFNRHSYSEECRLLARMGPRAYLSQAHKQIK